jgi:hypothetical protein
MPERVSQKITTEKYLISLLGLSMESTALLMFRKTAQIFQYSFAILSSQVCLTEFRYIPEENHSKVYTSGRTMLVSIMQGDPGDESWFFLYYPCDLT